MRNRRHVGPVVQWLADANRPALVVVAGALVIALIGQCYAHQELARVEQSHRKAERAEWERVEWHLATIDTLYACLHPRWMLDTRPRHNLTVDPDGSFTRTIVDRRN